MRCAQFGLDSPRIVNVSLSGLCLRPCDASDPWRPNGRLFFWLGRFLAMFIQRLDLNSRAFFAYIFTARWLGFRLDLAVILLLSGSCFLSVVVNEFGGNVGEWRKVMALMLRLGKQRLTRTVTVREGQPGRPSCLRWDSAYGNVFVKTRGVEMH